MYQLEYFLTTKPLFLLQQVTPPTTGQSGDAQTLEQQPESLIYFPQGIAMPYSPFTSVDGSWTPTFDPALFGYGPAATNVLTTQQLPNSAFYFPGNAADMNIWTQDSLATNPLLFNSFMLGTMVDQQQLSGSELPVESTTTAATTVDPITGLEQNFAGIALNGSIHGMIPAMVPTTPGTPGGIENSPQNVAVIVNQGQNTAPQPEKPKSWAAIASQPAKPRPVPPKPQPPSETTTDNVTATRKPQGGGRGMNRTQASGQTFGGQSGTGRGRGARKSQDNAATQPGGGSGSKAGGKANQSEVVGKLQSENKYNPSDMTMILSNARFFVIKSYAEDDIHRSIKYSIWTSTEHGNRRLDQAYREQKGKGNVYLLYSVNGSGHFCGVAQMVSEVEFNAATGVWAQDKWKGRFDVKWVYVKDVPNSHLRHIRLENNENKPVTNSRDTQEVPLAKAKQVMKIIHSYQHTTSIFDDFDHYERKQEEEKKV